MHPKKSSENKHLKTKRSILLCDKKEMHFFVLLISVGNIYILNVWCAVRGADLKSKGHYAKHEYDIIAQISISSYNKVQIWNILTSLEIHTSETSAFNFRSRKLSITKQT